MKRLLLVLVFLLAGCERAEPPADLPVGTSPGERAPALAGNAPDGEAFTLRQPPGQPTLLVFYRGADCGLCRVRLEQLQSFLPAYRHQGAQVLGITLDDPQLSRSLAEQMGLEFELVSVDSATFENWGVIEPERGVPMPAAYILDQQGVVQFAHVGRNAADRTTDAELLTHIETLRAR